MLSILFSTNIIKLCCIETVLGAYKYSGTASVDLNNLVRAPLSFMFIFINKNNNNKQISTTIFSVIQ